ncbi:MAG: flagellar biosynthesis protein FlhB [Fimbriimonas sp.]
MSEEGQEKTEDASPRRKQEARRDGNVAKSQDLVGATVTIALIASLPGIVSTVGQGFLQSVRASFTNLPTDGSFGHMGQAFWRALSPALPGVGYLLALAAGVGLVTTVAQTGFNISFKHVTPSFQKIDPMSGAKRMFSKRSLMEGAKAFVKFLLFGWIAYSAIAGNWEMLGSLSGLPPLGALAKIGELMRGVAMKVGMVWVVLAIVDYVFQKKQHDKQLKMTKDEVKREHKESEGSPEIKAARYQRRRKLMKQRVRDAVRTADVIVTNPTHFAVALKYDPEKNAAPIVVAKGVDVMAAKIREFAKEDRTPIVPNPRLARALYRQCEIGDPVPRELFAAVAEVLAYVYKVLKRVKPK